MEFQEMFCKMHFEFKGGAIEGSTEFNGNGVYQIFCLAAIIKSFDLHKEPSFIAAEMLFDAYDMAKKMEEEENEAAKAGAIH